MDQTKSGRVPWDIMVLSALTLFVCTLVLGVKNLNITLGDSDDAMRLVQLRNFIQNGNWYDLHVDRVSAPLGFISHWSRIPDLLMSGIYFTLKPFSSSEFAELVTRAIYPGLWIMVAFAATALFTWKTTGKRLAITLCLVLLASNGLTFVQFLAGRIDHHDAQIALSVLAVVSSAFTNANWRFAILTGVSSGLLLTVGLEGAPFMVIAGSVIAWRYVLFNTESMATRFYTFSFGLTTLFGLAISLPPTRWLETACDAIAFNLTAAIVTGCGVLFCWVALPVLSRSITTRTTGVLIAGFSAAAIYVMLDPACLHGPFGHVEPALKPLWLDRVQEMQPVFRWGEFNYNVKNLSFVLFALPALISIFWLARMKEFKTSLPFHTVVIAFLVSLTLGLINLRMTSYIVWFATPIHCFAIFKILEKLQGRKMLLAASAVAVILTSPLVLTFAANQMAIYSAYPEQHTVQGSQDCRKSADYQPLSKLPQGLALAELDMGSYILALTPHSVVAAPYHRIGDNILRDIQFFETDTMEQAHQMVKDKHVTFVVMCKSSGQPLAVNTGLLGQGLRAGVIPPWLVPLSTEAENPVEIFLVKEANS